MKKVPVLEIFGPTIQGEGMVIGQKTMFVRTGGCDYRCSWCDSAFTWDGSQKPDLMQADEIVEKLEKQGGDVFNHVTISGGNPALHSGLAEVISLLQNKGIKTAVETQGTIWQDWMLEIDDVTISPKPPSSGMETNWNKLDMYMRELLNHSNNDLSLKVVIFDEDDLTYAATVHERYPEVDMFLQTGNDELETSDNSWLLSHLLEKYEWLVDKVLQSERLNEVKVLPQLHTLLWGNKQGV
ncbi:7-carboxy-7-deazaguanine synthase QueE [Salibacterium salarium]|uniref:7-carboxy-7-deazaguanine synthase n=1 Tax=Salibacterium salarium TaxID=284579 RepID=A0A428MTB1_9BACI|nr:7-carboxy-7-deazaguanine synthase QueE [Salibacterium salarium]RSL29369.1 7-carboxy-7-deazaguanine synthase QueE [Salibacterium salarium]